MNIAFVASTLPAAFIREHATRLEIKKVVCATRDLVESYMFIRKTHRDLEIEALPKGKIEHFLSIFRHILNCKKVYFSHECCWPLFDLALIITRRKAVWFPQSSMKSFRLVAPEELSFLAQMKFYYSNQHKIRPFRSGITTLIRRWFDVYEAVLDGGKGFYQCQSLRTDLFSFIEKLDDKQFGVSKPHQHKESQKTYKVLIACAREPIDDEVQIKLYSEVCSFVERKGYRIYIKDHPYKDSRLGFVYPGSEVIPAHFPIECIDEKFDFVVGVASASILRSNLRALSLLHLLPFSEEVFLSRLTALSVFDGYSNIRFLKSIEEISEIIDG